MFIIHKAVLTSATIALVFLTPDTLSAGDVKIPQYAFAAWGEAKGLAVAPAFISATV